MVTFDIQNRVTEYLGRCKIFIIPTNDNNKINCLNYVLLEKLKYENAPNYYEASMDEIEAYIREYYVHVLSKLDPNDISNRLKDSYLASDERTDSIAKRHIFCEWLKLFTNEKINEMSIDENGKIKKLEIPNIIGFMLEKVIRESIEDMKGFESLRAFYLYEMSEKYEEEMIKYSDNKMFYAQCNEKVNKLRNQAEAEEKLYRKNKKNGYCKNI